MNFKKIESKWQKVWEKNNWYPAKDFAKAKDKKYILVEFPYPSGEGLHIGHAFTMTGADVYARYHRMNGDNVLFPMGWDAFGLPTENYAIKTGVSPQKATEENTTNFKRQMKKMAFSFDWNREVNTTDPKYYQWTQWIFIQLYKHGLAYKEEKPINWCPSCKVGLANEEVIDGKCERCGAETTRRNIKQWIVKITEYADKLIEGLEKVDFMKKVEAAQLNWIGRSKGAKIKFRVTANGEGEDARIGEERGLRDRKTKDDPGFVTLTDERYLEVFTTRPDTLWGATFMVIAPEHPLTQKILNSKSGHTWSKSEIQSQRHSEGEFIEPEESPDDGILPLRPASLQGGQAQGQDDKVKEIKEYIERARKKSELERSELQKEKTGVFTGLYAINPVTEKKIPIWISDFVLATYGTGAIMGVPAHDDRDFQFAKKYDLEITSVVKPSKDWDFDNQAYIEIDKGEAVNSGPINGLKTKEAIKKSIEYLQEIGAGGPAVDYHLRDWIFSRQHYWGEPIPMIFCSECGWQPVPEKDLPVKLPRVEKYQPSNSGESPLAKVSEWVKTTCPQCGGQAQRETDTMPNWAGSNWYYLAYLVASQQGNSKLQTPNPKQNVSIFKANMDKLNYWLPVDVYIGGDEHNTLHLLYSRFIYQFLHDIGQMPEDIPEAYHQRISHGVILGQDNQRMSKSRGNVITPDRVWKKHGVDALRTYLMFMGPFTGTMAWNENAFQGVVRFLNKFEKFILKSSNVQNSNVQKKVKVILNKTIKKVTEDIERFSYNTAIAALMECVNELKEISPERNYSSEVTLDGSSDGVIELSQKKKLVKLIAPFAPYLAEELWHELHSLETSEVPEVTSGSCEAESVHRATWPKVDEKYLQAKIVEIPVQVNGKLRGTVELEAGNSKIEDRVVKKAKENPNVAGYLIDKEIKKIIFIPGKLINFVV